MNEGTTEIGRLLITEQQLRDQLTSSIDEVAELRAQLAAERAAARELIAVVRQSSWDAMPRQQRAADALEALIGKAGG